MLKKRSMPLRGKVMNIRNPLCRQFLNQMYFVGKETTCLYIMVIHTIGMFDITLSKIFLIARFKGPTWGPPGADRTQVGPCWPHERWCLGCYPRYLWSQYIPYNVHCSRLGCVLFCVVKVLCLMCSCDVFTHILQCCFTDAVAIIQYKTALMPIKYSWLIFIKWIITQPLQNRTNRESWI